MKTFDTLKREIYETGGWVDTDTSYHGPNRIVWGFLQCQKSKATMKYHFVIYKIRVILNRLIL